MTRELPALDLKWIKKPPNGWLATNLGINRFAPPLPARILEIERLARHTDALGPMPLWEGYNEVKNYRPGTSRRAQEVGTKPDIGSFFTWFVESLRPALILECGTGFGVSGMYFLCGLEQNQHGTLVTFEPNLLWARIARENLAAIGSRFELVCGTFEENIDRCLANAARIDLAYIDGIHTKDVVLGQFRRIAPRARDGGVMLFDDINFSQEMIECWQTLSRDPVVHASLEIDERVGVIEVGR